MDKYNLIEKLKNCPSYLFLGQNYSKHSYGVDPLLESINSHFFKDIENCNYDLYLKIKKDYAVETALSWIQNRARKISGGDYLKKVSMINWNGIFTSSVDSIVENSLKNEWRNTQSVVNVDHYPKYYRSKTELHITYLFGNVNQSELGERPPLDSFELITSKEKATKFMSRITQDFITPYGVLIIDGYDINSDWYEIERLYPVVTNLGFMQVFMFGISKFDMENKFLQKLIEDEKLIVFNESFHQFLNVTEELGYWVEEDFIGADIASEILVSINRKIHAVPVELYNKVSRSAKLLDDSLIIPGHNPPKEELKELFRKFLSNMSSSPVWDGYKYNFNIEREFESEIESILYSKLSNQNLNEKPIILHGQTGTGKSIALGNLAYKLKMERKYPVLYINNENSIVSNDDIREICEWLQNSEDVKIVIIWDDSTCSSNVEQYINLNNYLSSKGKKAIVIGSAYLLNSKSTLRNVADYVEAKINLTSSEVESIKNIFEQYSDISNLIDWRSSKLDNSFLVSLYRYLPATKFSIRRGIVNEADVNRMLIKKNLEATPYLSGMALAFKNANIPVDFFDTYLESKNESFEEIYVGKLFDIISIVGQYGLGMPIDLLLRVLPGIDNVVIIETIEEIDFFRLVVTTKGDYIIYPRHSLEAKILADSSIVNVEEQVKLFIDIIKMVSSGEFQHHSEIDFLVELLKAIGPNGETSKYADYYGDISKELLELREKRGILFPRLALQEATYVRRHIQFNDFMTSDDKLKFLKNGETAIRDSINLIEPKSPHSQFLGVLYCEISSNIGFQIQEMRKLNYDIRLIRDAFAFTSDWLSKSRCLTVASYHPVDVKIWVSREMYMNSVDENEKYEIISSLLSYLDLVELESPELTMDEQYLERMVQIEEFYADRAIPQMAFDRLIEQKSAAGIYVTARKMCDGIDFKKPLENNSNQIVSQVIEYLKCYSDLVYKDKRCLYLILKLVWAKNAEVPMFYKEKTLLAFSQNIWKEILDILEKISFLEKNEESNKIKYLKALCLFHLSNFEGCYEVFSEIREDNYNMGYKRVIINYLASDEEGMPLTYTGQLKDKDDKKATFYIKELRKSFPFYHKDFVNKDLELNSTFNNIQIGFNFLGIQVVSINDYSREVNSYEKQ